MLKMLMFGQLRLGDQLGNAEADAAADLGRRHQSEVLIDEAAQGSWFLVSHHALTAQVYDCCCWGFCYHDGTSGTAPDPEIWDQGGSQKSPQD